jgi:phosphopantetheine adenylyltransferase
MGDAARSALPDVIVYPQNLPNTAPESWIDIQPDLDCVCSHDSLTGWISECESDRGRRFENREGAGGLDEHVAALNSERSSRKLPPVAALKVTDKKWPADSPEVIFLDDELEEQEPCRPDYGPPASDWKRIVDDEPDNDLQLAGARLPANKKLLFDSVAVGGTFDGMHFGHRKLLTLAVSSVTPLTGKLLVGVTVDDMLTNKKYAEHIPCFEERCAGVRSFLDRLAPGMINRVHVTPITDSFGPPGTANQHFDALVLSHETLGTGHKLNQHRVEHLGLHPLKLLCTRRTEVHGMSSTALRKLKSQQQQWMETI